MALGSHSDDISQHTPRRLSVWVNKSATDIGVSAKAGNTTANSSWIPCAGFNQVTVLVSITNSGAGSSQTPFTFGIDVSNDESTAYPLQTAATSSGTATLSKLTYSKATGDASINFAVDFPLNYKYFRINTPTLTNGVSGDSYSIEVNLGKV
tara:strand:- start:1291 stop:1746 length:456 start_codon:yes stop_codon:yes gene_type:complete